MLRKLLPVLAIAALLIVAAFAIFDSGEDAAPPVEVDMPGEAEPAAPDFAAKNVIIMISDGMGFYHLEAAQLYQHGPGGTGIFEEFPVQLAMTTFDCEGDYDPEEACDDPGSVDDGYTDSAAAGTALASGIKTYSGAIGVDDSKSKVRNIIEAAEKKDRRTGVVSSVQFAHATPASFIAHNESRNNYTEIAREMLLESSADVIMGAGHPEYDNTGRLVEGQREYKYVGGLETWLEVMRGKAGADADGDGEADPWTLIQDREQFERLQFGQTPDRVLGVPRIATTLQQSRDIDPESDDDEKAAPFETPLNERVPTLEMMTRGALNVLDNGDDGLLLMVEGGAVDWASHANQSGRMIEEQIDFDNAVQAAIDWVEEHSSWDETLLIVTADHETGHLAGPDAEEEWTAPQCCGRGVQPEMAWYSGDHTNSLVPLFARGAGAEALKDRVQGEDPMWGDYVDNVDIAEIMFAAIGERVEPPAGAADDPRVAAAN